MLSPWPMKHKMCPARSGCVLTPLGVLHRPGRWVVELWIERLQTRSLGFIAYVSNRFPPVFSPQMGSGTEKPCSESACGILNA